MLSIVRLGSPRSPREGLRIGTVRRPPRAIPKAEFATRDFYDVWLPTLAPSDALRKQALAIALDDERSWQQFARKFRREMQAGDAAHILATLAALSKKTDFSVGCYCELEARCHRSVLRQLFIEHGAAVRD